MQSRGFSLFMLSVISKHSLHHSEYITFCDQSNLTLSVREGSGLSSWSRSTFTDLLTLAGKKYTGQSAALYLNQGACDQNNNGMPV